MKRIILFLAPLLGLLLISCDVLPGFGSNTPDECNDLAAGVLFRDSFEGEENCGWAEYNRGGAVAAVEDGAMRLSTSQPGQIWWTNPGRTLDDVVINVTARQASGPDDNAYGVICRYQDEQNFYVFLISGDGYYAIGKYQSDGQQVTYLTPDGQFAESDVINQGEATNQIQATCIGNQLSLAVNGITLATVSDANFASGDVGVAVSTLQPGTVVVEFDDFAVFAPAAGPLRSVPPSTSPSAVPGEVEPALTPVP